LLAVQSRLPGCLAFEPLCLNTCARAHIRTGGAWTRLCERLCASSHLMELGPVKLPGTYLHLPLGSVSVILSPH
jgi:hypothetical protein